MTTSALATALDTALAQPAGTFTVHELPLGREAIRFPRTLAPEQITPHLVPLIQQAHMLATLSTKHPEHYELRLFPQIPAAS